MKLFVHNYLRKLLNAPRENNPTKLMTVMVSNDLPEVINSGHNTE